MIEAAGYDVRQYGPDDIVAFKGAHCKSLMIVTEGRVRSEVTDPAGKSAKVEEISAPAVLVPVLLYAREDTLPVSIVATEPASVLFIGREQFSRIMQGEIRVMENFLGMVSDRNKPLSDKMMYMGFKTIRSKFANLLLEQSEREKALSFRLKVTQREMAGMFGVTRPALARAIGEMSDEGAVYVDRKNVTILYPEKLKQYARE